MDWFLYDRDVRHERVKVFSKFSLAQFFIETQYARTLLLLFYSIYGIFLFQSLSPTFLAILLVASLLGHLTVGNSTTNEETHEKCIKDANRKFASLAQSIYQSGIFDGAINNLKCIYVSNQFLRIYKLSLARLIKKTDFKLGAI